MSEYVTIQTQFRIPELLVRALQDMGFAWEQIEVHPEPVPLYGYQGDRRPERAEVIIRRSHVGRHANDLGFARQPDGTYRAIISEYDQRHAGAHGPYDQAWLGRLAQGYSLRLLERAYRERGWRVSAQRQANGVIELIAES